MKFEKAIKQTKFESEQQKAILNVLYTANWLRDQQGDIFKPFSILPQHFNVLRILRGQHPKPVSPGDIKEVMIDKNNDVTRLIDKLVKMELVSRHLCAENRRKMDVHITSKGLKLLEKMDSPLKESFKDIRKRLSEKEANILSDLLDKLRD